MTLDSSPGKLNLVKPSTSLHRLHVPNDEFLAQRAGWGLLGELWPSLRREILTDSSHHGRLFAELGPGERISLAKLAEDHFISTGRPLRIAIDVSIWSFQIQAAQGKYFSILNSLANPFANSDIGGANPALRTLYYRLNRLLSYPIFPLFVFDGPSRPSFKRNKKTTAVPGYITSSQKRLIALFGFPYHVAPGEAEAECANLQKTGVVDATLSEDVDTLMFGCGLMLRNWSSEGGSAATPTHVSVYNLEKIEREKGLSPKGMIMIALMRGGDYIPEGIPQCGIRFAADAAKAGFGEELCAIADNDAALRGWRERFTMELRTNQSKHFSRRNNKIHIPNTFPDKQVMGYYLAPTVSPATAPIIVNGPNWGGRMDIDGLRAFVRDAFEWKGKGGAYKMMRTMAPGLLVNRLLHYRRRVVGGVSLSDLVAKISSRRVHPSTDGLSQLRVAYIPASVVPLADQDPEDRSEPFVDDDDDNNDDDDDDGDGGDGGDDDDHGEGAGNGSDAEPGAERGKARRKPKDYNPYIVERAWISERVLRLAIPERVKEWEESLRKPKKKTLPKPKTAAVPRRGRAKAVEGKQAPGSIGGFVKVSKATAAASVAEGCLPPRTVFKPPRAPSSSPPSLPLPPPAAAGPKPPAAAAASATRAVRKPSAKSSASKAPVKAAASNTNPWTLAKLASQPASSQSSYSGISPAVSNTTACPRASKSKTPSKIPVPKKRSCSESNKTPVKPRTTPTRSLLVSASPSPLLSTKNVWRDPLKYYPEFPPSPVTRNRRPSSRSRLPSANHEIPSTPACSYDYQTLDSDFSSKFPSPIHLHDKKRHSSPIEVIEISSSPIVTSTTKCTHTNPPPGSPSLETPKSSFWLISSEESPSKKHKTQENVRRASPLNRGGGVEGLMPSQRRRSSARPSGGFLLEDDSTFDNDDFGYDGHFGFCEQEGLFGSSPELDLGKVNRVLDFSNPTPHKTVTYFSDDLLPGSPNSLPQPQPLYINSRTISNASTTSTGSPSHDAFSPNSPIDLSTPSALINPIRDFSWITTTRGNFSPRKQLKRVMEGVFPAALSPQQQPPPDNTHHTQNGRSVSSGVKLQEIMAQSETQLQEERHYRISPTAAATATRPGSGSALLPAFNPDKMTAEEQAQAKLVATTPPRPRRTQSCIPIPSAKKNKVSVSVTKLVAAPPEKPKLKKANLKPITTLKQRQETDPVSRTRQINIPPPAQSQQTQVVPAQQRRRVRQSIASGRWKEEENAKTIEYGAEGRKVVVWEDLEVLDLTGECD